MATNYVIKGTGNIAFGTGDVSFASAGKVLTASDNETGDKLELKDEAGGVFLVIYFNDKNECEIKVIWDQDYVRPARGDQIDICGLVDVLVDEARKDWENEKEAQLTIRATKYASGAMVLGA